MSGSARPLVRDARLRTDASDVVTRVSVVVPVSERPHDLDLIYGEYSAPLDRIGIPFEFVFVVEPWAREMAEALRPLIEADEPIRVFEVGQRIGEAAMISAALPRTRGEVIVTLPAYPRIRPDGLVDLVQRVDEGADLASARRIASDRSLLNRLQNRLFHLLLRVGIKSDLRDVASGVRAMRRQVLEEIPLYGDFFRFLPVLAEREGFEVQEIPLPQHPEDARTRLYSPGVYLRRLIDLLGLFFVLRFTRKPLRFFGLIGAAISGVGAVILLVLFVQRLGGEGIADRPMLLLGVLLFVLGVQALGIGLVGEIIVHLSASEGRQYRVRDEGRERD